MQLLPLSLAAAILQQSKMTARASPILANQTASDYEFSLQKKEPRDGTHHAAPQMAPISYAMPRVASVGSSIAAVTANPLSAWKAAIASRVIGPSIPSTGPS
jgi:hypothetical protein